MKNIPAYFDGNTVRTLDAYPFVKNQRLIITILDDTEKGGFAVIAYSGEQRTITRAKERHIFYFCHAGHFVT